MPPKATAPTSFIDASVTATKYLQNFKEMMLKTKEERMREAEAMTLEEQRDAEPYLDPNIAKDIKEFGIRMAMSGMLRGTRYSKARVGLFTVVKKVEKIVEKDAVEEKVHPRLVFDQRTGNRAWQEPWTPLAGPGAFASIDVTNLLEEEEEAEEILEMGMVAGDLPDCFYRWGLPADLSEWFIIPEPDFEEIMSELEKRGESETVKKIRADSAQGSKCLGMAMTSMGWNWAVFLAQSGSIDMLEMVKDEEGMQILPKKRALVEGLLAPEQSLVEATFFAYIGDYGIIVTKKRRQGAMSAPEIGRRIKEVLKERGFPVHKEEEGSKLISLGSELGGKPMGVFPASEKMWLCTEALGEFARTGKRKATAVESVIALATWFWMIERSALSIFQEVYPWVRMNRETKKVLPLPEQVRCELAAAAAILPMIGQLFRMPWHRKVMLFDASDYGGGCCETIAAEE